jgi:hypothetical protein
MSEFFVGALKGKLNAAHQLKQQLVMLATDVNTLLGWMSIRFG